MPADRRNERIICIEPAAAGTQSVLQTPRRRHCPARLAAPHVGVEAEGMSGHLDEVSLYCRSDGNGWLNTGNPRAYSNWEELPYWLKGFGDLGYVLKDERVTKKARKWIGSMLSSSQPDGWFGPIINKTRSDGKPDVWPNMMALDILQSFHEATGDKRVIEVMTKYFRWELSVPEKDFLVSWSQREPATIRKACIGSTTEPETRGSWTLRRRSMPTPSGGAKARSAATA